MKLLRLGLGGQEENQMFNLIEPKKIKIPYAVHLLSVLSYGESSVSTPKFDEHQFRLAAYNAINNLISWRDWRIQLTNQNQSQFVLQVL